MKNPTEYKKRQVACDCLTMDRRSYVEAAMDFAADFPDGAFMAYMDERGIDVSELEAFSVEHNCRKKALKGIHDRKI